MAITINNAANSKAPAYNQLVYQITSNNSGNTNFNFVVDIYVGGVLATRQLYPKQPSTNSIKIDISPILKNYVSYDVPAQNQGFLQNHQADYYIQFGEAYDVSGTLTIFPNLTRHPSGSGVQSVFNSIFDYEEFTPNIQSSYEVTTFGILTERPEPIVVNPNDKLLFAWYDPNDNASDFELGNFTDGIVLTSGKYYYKTDVSLLLSSFFNYAVGEYVYSFNGGSFASGIIKVQEYCNKYPKYRLHWLNRLGGWDSYNFGKVSQESISVEARDFKKYQTLGYSSSDRLITKYNTMIKDTISIQTDWVSDEMSEWFKGLFESPIVYLERPNNTLFYDMVAINIVDTQYQVQKFANGRRMHNITLSFQYSYDRYRQSL